MWTDSCHVRSSKSGQHTGACAVPRRQRAAGHRHQAGNFRENYLRTELRDRCACAYHTLWSVGVRIVEFSVPCSGAGTCQVS